MKRRDLGVFGENIACTYLSRHHYSIIARNVYSRFGEIDIVAEDNGVLVFVEVKTRYCTPEDGLLSVLSVRKRRALHRASLDYIANKSEVSTYRYWRYDLVVIILSKVHPKIMHKMYALVP